MYLLYLSGSQLGAVRKDDPRYVLTTHLLIDWACGKLFLWEVLLQDFAADWKSLTRSVSVFVVSIPHFPEIGLSCCSARIQVWWSAGNQPLSLTYKKVKSHCKAIVTLEQHCLWKAGLLFASCQVCMNRFRVLNMMNMKSVVHVQDMRLPRRITTSSVQHRLGIITLRNTVKASFYFFKFCFLGL